MPKLLRDNSTGKLIRDSSTGKLQRMALEDTDCEFCGPGATPSKITLTLSDLAECECFKFGDFYYRTVGVPAIFNNTSFGLQQAGPHVWEGWPWPYFENFCEWYRFLTGYFGELRAYWTTDCTGAYLSFPISYLSLYVKKTAVDSLIISVYLQGDVGAGELIGANAYTYAVWNGSEWVGKVASIADCMVVINLANINECEVTPNVCCGAGMTSIVEGSTEQSYTQYRTSLSDAAVQWNPASDNYKNVDDPIGSPDDDVSYNYTNVMGNEDLFNIPAFNVPAGATITNVQLVGRYKRIEAGGGDLIRPLIRVGGSIYYASGEQFVPGAYFTRTSTWPNNPKTAVAWTVDAVNAVGINALQGIGYQCAGFHKTAHCTQLYVKVNYTYTY